MKTPNYIHIKETKSTNQQLRELLKEQNFGEGTVLVSDIQTAGRGQMGNSWESEPLKNLTFSILLQPEHIEANKQFIISQIVSLAIVEALASYSDRFTIKWPNDIYWNEKKIAGILIENDLTGKKIASSIIGIGLNVNQEIFLSPAPNPVSLKQIIKRESDLQELLQTIVEGIFNYYEKSIHEGVNCIVKKYSNLLFRKNGFHRYGSKDRIFRAEIAGIEDSGLLILREENGEEKSYAFKEISFLL